MKIATLLLSLLTGVALFFPFFFFSLAFYSQNQQFKSLVTNHVEGFYLFFVFMGIIVAVTITKLIVDRNRISPQRKTSLLLLLKIIVSLYGIFLIINSTARFITYKSEAIDIMFFKEAIWQLSSFQLPTYAWAQHFTPIFIFFVPLFWFFKSGAMLMFIQAASVVSGAIPLYFIAKEKLHSQLLGLALATSYVTFGGLQVGFAYGFHEILFLPPLFFWTYYFFIKKRLRLYILFVLLCLCVKEEVSFIMIFWGFYLLYKKQYRYAIITASLGLVWYVLSFYLIIPYFNKGSYGFWGYYPNTQNGLFGLLSFALLHPLEFLETITTPKYKIDTLFHTFGNFSFLSFLYPPSLLIVIPSLFQKLLTSDIAAKNGFHYSAAIAAVTMVSVIESIAFVQKRQLFKKLIKHQNTFLGILIIYVACSANILYGHHPLSPLLLGREAGLSAQERLVLNHTLDVIPPDATIAAQYYIRSHINRPYWQTFDAGGNDSADYMIVHMNLPFVMSETQILEKHITSLVKEGKYEVIFNSQGTLLLQKKPVPSK